MVHSWFNLLKNVMVEYCLLDGRKELMVQPINRRGICDNIILSIAGFNCQKHDVDSGLTKMVDKTNLCSTNSDINIIICDVHQS